MWDERKEQELIIASNPQVTMQKGLADDADVKDRSENIKYTKKKNAHRVKFI